MSRPESNATTLKRVGRPPGTQNTRTGTTDRSSSASNSLDELRQHSRRRVVVGRQPQHLDLGVGVLAPLALAASR